MGGVVVLAVLIGMGGKAQGQSIHVQYPDTVRYVHGDEPYDTIQSTPFEVFMATNMGYVWTDRFFSVFHCDSPIEIAGIAFSGYLNENRRKDAKSWLYLLGFSQSGNGEMVILDSSLYNAEKEPVVLEYPFAQRADNIDTVPYLLMWEMLFANTHIVSDSFAVALVNPQSAPYCYDNYINPNLCGGSISVDLIGDPSVWARAVRDYTISDIGCLPNSPYPNHMTVAQFLDQYGSYENTFFSRRVEGLFEPIRATDCPKMESVRIDSVDMTQAWLSWPSCDSAASYRVEYMLHGGHFGDGQWVTGITDTFCCIQNLQPGRAYDFYVQAFCPRQQQYGLPSYPAEAMLGDTAVCPDVPGLRIDWRNPDIGVLSIAFDSLDEHLRYQIAVCPYGCEDPELGRIYDVDENPYYLYDLDTNTYYAAYARAQCSHECLVHHDSLFWGGWGDPIYFYAGRNNPLGITTAEAASFTVTPNPARSHVVVAFDGSCDVAHALLVLRDASGKELRRLAPSAATAEMSLQGLAAGTYFLTLATPQGSSTQKLVIEP